MMKYFNGVKLTNDSNDRRLGEMIYHSTTIDDYDNPKWIDMINNEGLDAFYEYCTNNNLFRPLKTYQGIECFEFCGLNEIKFNPSMYNKARTANKISQFFDSMTVLRTNEGCYTIDDYGHIVKDDGYGMFVSTDYKELPNKPKTVYEFVQALRWQYERIDPNVWKLLTDVTTYTQSVSTVLYVCGLDNPTNISEYVNACERWGFDVEPIDIAVLCDSNLDDLMDFCDMIESNS